MHLVNSPLWHSAPLRFAIGSLLAGGRVLIPARFDPGTVLSLLREQVATTTASWSRRTSLGSSALPELGEAERFGSLRLLAHAGAACPPATRLEAIRRSPRGSLVEFYGSTEGQFTVCSCRGLARASRTPSGGLEPGAGSSLEPARGRPRATRESARLWCERPPSLASSTSVDPAATAAAWPATPSAWATSAGVDEDGLPLPDRSAPGPDHQRRRQRLSRRGRDGAPGRVDGRPRGWRRSGLDDEDWGQRVVRGRRG